MTAEEFFKKFPIDWSDIRITIDSWEHLQHEYSLRPQDFISFAREDLKIAGARGLVNALSNAKRAIDCQVDTAVSALGYAPSELQKQLGKTRVHYIDSICLNKNQPLPFRLLESLGIITPAIVGKMRKVRHLLEHHYKKPKKSVVSDAIDVAQLFIHATERMLMQAFTSFSLGSGEIKTIADPQDDKYVFYINRPHPFFEIRYWDREKQQLWRKKQKNRRYPTPILKVYPSDAIYYPLIRLALAMGEPTNCNAILSDLIATAGLKAKVKITSMS